MATPFIVVILLIVLVCVTVAIIVGRFMHTNNGIDALDAEPIDASSAPTDGVPIPVPIVPAMPVLTGPLPPFIVNPTQPLSEIYYHEGLPPDAPPAGPDVPDVPGVPGVPPIQPDAPPPTGPLPMYHHNQ
ncbi:MAG: hypothetical protein NVS2B12_35160 [Ktedonobacteraceae bacterium]